MLSVVLLLGSCAAYLAPPVTPEFAARSPAPLARLQRGYEVHQQSCAKCHPFEDPRNYSEAKWRTDIMPGMAEEAKLGEADQKAVLDYLLAARQIPTAGND